VPRTQVTFAAYLAVLLGTFFPVTFLITLYIQSESMKAGEDSMLE
jgi:photosystem II reaction center protein PsbM